MSESKSEANTSLLGMTYQGVIDVPTPDGIGSAKTVEFTTTIGKDCSQSDLDDLLDKCRSAVTRQRVFAQIEKKTVDLINLEGALALGDREIKIADAKNSKRAEDHEGRAGRGLSSSELKERQAKVEAMENAAQAVKTLKEKILSLRQMVSLEAVTTEPCLNGESPPWADNGGAMPS